MEIRLRPPDPPLRSWDERVNAHDQHDERVGVVAIGRNEGERLKRCLTSLLAQGADPIVYVDSGSTDGSVEFAQANGVEVVALDMSLPFTMARARNAGFEHLTRSDPDLRWVQFVDGDCEVNPRWIATGLETLRSRPDVAVVAGRVRERHPEDSIYNRLLDMEWDGPIGEVGSCGGNAMYRAEVLRDVGTFNPEMIAGEEPELCLRICRAGWKVLRIPDEMVLHDAAMTRFEQWWTRMRRGGHARVDGMVLHAGAPERHNKRETLSALVYGAILPLTGVSCGTVALLVEQWRGWALGAVGAIALLYLRLFLRVFRYRRGLGSKPKHALLYASFIVVGKVPEALGVLTHVGNRLRGRRTALIEYKRSAS